MIECSSTTFKHVSLKYRLLGFLPKRHRWVHTRKIQVKWCINDTLRLKFFIDHDSILILCVGGPLSKTIDRLRYFFIAFNDVTVFPLSLHLNLHSLSILFRFRTQFYLLLSIISAAIHGNLESIQVFLLLTRELYTLLLKQATHDRTKWVSDCLRKVVEISLDGLESFEDVILS